MIGRARLCGRLVPQWLAEECELGSSYHEGAGALYDSWRRFAHAHREEPGSPPEFAGAMERRGFTVDRLCGERTRIRWGLRLRRPPGPTFKQ